MGRKYTLGAAVKACEFTDYTNEQILKLMDSVQANSLERTDLIHIIRELAYRNTVLETSVARF